MFTNTHLADGLDRIASLVGSHAQRLTVRRAAALIRFAPRPVAERIEESGVEGVHELGIDYELSGVITDWVRSGRLRWLERLEERRREELFEVPGIGPKLARELKQVLGVEDLQGLGRALRDGQLGRICGFGPKRMKTIEAVLAARAA